MLLDLFEEHLPAFEYDWRTRFHLPLTVVGVSMTYGEAWRLTGLLAGDPSSQTAASISGWEHPASREQLVLMDLFDLQHTSKSRRKPRPYPRPYKDQSRRRFGRSPFSPEKTRAILDARRHGTT